MEPAFWGNLGVTMLCLYLVQYACGLLAAYKSVKVNYTRKIVHFCLFLIPLSLERLFPYEQTTGMFLIRSVVSVSTLIIYIKPIRKRVPLINMMFASFDRPEDRTYTLLWLFTQVAAGYLVIIPCIAIFMFRGLESLILIPVLITAIGDGLAEPVGVRFGRYRYRVRALFAKRHYHRTLEGSACVFIASVLIVGVHHDSFSLPQLVAALLVIPVLMTLAEALSPHTWDTPALFLAGYAALFGVSFL